jgi:hypothetical protein
MKPLSFKIGSRLGRLINFEKNEEDGKDPIFNFILSNGTRSTQRDENYPTNYSFIIPADELNKIRSVTIHYVHNLHILGFSFFDKVGALLWKIGDSSFWLETAIVLLEENEVIVGVVAKLNPDCQSVYTDF